MLKKTGFGLFSVTKKKLFKNLLLLFLCKIFIKITKITKLFETLKLLKLVSIAHQNKYEKYKKKQDLSKYETTHVSLTCCLVHISSHLYLFYSFIWWIRIFRTKKNCI